MRGGAEVGVGVLGDSLSSTLGLAVPQESVGRLGRCGRLKESGITASVPARRRDWPCGYDNSCSACIGSQRRAHEDSSQCALIMQHPTCCHVWVCNASVDVRWITACVGQRQERKEVPCRRETGSSQRCRSLEQGRTPFVAGHWLTLTWICRDDDGWSCGGRWKRRCSQAYLQADTSAGERDGRFAQGRVEREYRGKRADSQVHAESTRRSQTGAWWEGSA